MRSFRCSYLPEMLPDLIDQEYAMKMSNIIWEAVIQIKPLSYIYLQATLLFFFFYL